LPPAIRAYLTAHVARDVDAALAQLTDDALVTDEGHTFRGHAEIAAFLRDAASEYTYTTTLTGAARSDDTHWVARHHLEGDFPGGVADLDLHFTLRGGRIAELVIAP
jgi:ketosteroid isomerase-like protein